MTTATTTTKRVEYRKSAKAEGFTFGIEIECFVPHGTLPVGGYHRGTTLESFGFPRGWNAQSDGSLNAYVSGYKAIEIVSPVLMGRAGLLEVIEVVRKLRTEYRAKLRKCGGIHVHVGVASFTNINRNPVDVLAEIGRVVIVAGQCEDGLLGATGAASRVGSRWAHSIKSSVNGAQDTTKEARARMVERMRRYMTLNVTNVNGLRSGSFASSKPTIEFRCFPASLNAVKIAAWVQMVLGIVELATSTKTYRAKGLSSTKRDDEGRGYGRQGRFFRKGTEQLLSRLRWNSKGRCVIETRGNEKVRVMPMLGWVLDRGDAGITHKAVVKEVRRLAKKLDENEGAVRSQLRAEGIVRDRRFW